MTTLRTMIAAAALLAALSPAHAVDGVVLINQQKALDGNVSPGDAPGFPVMIRAPGSYRLSGNLAVPDNTTPAILVTAANVTIDLNGFVVSGALCGPQRCVVDPPVESGIEIHAANVRVHGGTVTNFSGHGVKGSGSTRLHDLRATRNGQCGAALTFYGAATESLFAENGGCGLEMVTGLASRNVFVRNAGAQLRSVNPDQTLADTNRFDDNTPLDAMQGVRSLGNNLCNALAC